MSILLSILYMCELTISKLRKLSFYPILRTLLIYRTMDIFKADIFDYIERFQNPHMRRRVARSDLQFSTFL